MKSVNKIFEDVVRRVAVKYGNNVIVPVWRLGVHKQPAYSLNQSPKTSPLKFPIVCLYSPFVEDRTEAETSASLDFIIMVNTLKTYTNERGKRLRLSRCSPYFINFSLMK